MNLEGIGRAIRYLALLLVVALTFPLSVQAAEQSSQAHNEITQLIDAVAHSGCSFVRNGTEHAATAAADHLKLKWRRGKKYADTAEGFIDNLASKSSWTGKPYSIRCPNQPEQKSSDWLRQKLVQIRSQTSHP